MESKPIIPEPEFAEPHHISEGLEDIPAVFAANRPPLSEEELDARDRQEEIDALAKERAEIQTRIDAGEQTQDDMRRMDEIAIDTRAAQSHYPKPQDGSLSE